MLSSVWESKREVCQVYCSLKQQLLVLCIKKLLLPLLHLKRALALSFSFYLFVLDVYHDFGNVQMFSS